MIDSPPSLASMPPGPRPAPASADAAHLPATPGALPVLVFLAWSAIGLFFGLRQYVNHWLFGGRTDPQPVWVLLNVVDTWYWALLTLPIAYLARRFRFSGRGWAPAVAVHLAGAISTSLGNVVFNLSARRLVLPDDTLSFVMAFRETFYTNFQWYLLIVGATYTIHYHRRLRDREVHAARLDESLARARLEARDREVHAERLDKSLAEARLEALKMQIQPHFLFNTLHTISELVHEDPEAAERVIVRLGDLLRLTVDNARAAHVTLAQEVEFLEAYLEIQRTRFHDRLQVEVTVAPGTASALVPNLVLQPLVENAIRHGAASRGGLGRILVKCERRGARLRLEVHDNGPGPHPAPAPGGRVGVGVQNTRARLEQMYAERGTLELTHCPIGGTIAAVEIPFSLAPEHAPAGVAHTLEVSA